jgi:hypothetical protein
MKLVNLIEGNGEAAIQFSDDLADSKYSDEERQDILKVGVGLLKAGFEYESMGFYKDGDVYIAVEFFRSTKKKSAAARVIGRCEAVSLTYMECEVSSMAKNDLVKLVGQVTTTLEDMDHKVVQLEMLSSELGGEMNLSRIGT